MSIGEDELRGEATTENFLPSTAGSVRSQRNGTIIPQEKGGGPSLSTSKHQRSTADPHLHPKLFSKESQDSGDTIVESMESICKLTASIEESRDQTYQEDGEVYNELEPDGISGRKNLRLFLGMNDGQKPQIPEKKRGESVLSVTTAQQKTNFATIADENAAAFTPAPALPPNHPPPISETPKLPQAHLATNQTRQACLANTTRPTHAAAANPPVRAASERRNLSPNKMATTKAEMSRRHSQFVTLSLSLLYIHS